MITSHHSCSVPSAVVCTIGRVLDFRNAAYFHRQYDELLGQGLQYFILDFSGTEVFDSAGLGAIFGLHKRIAPEGGRVMFVAPSRSVATILRLIRSERVFRTYSSVEAALDDLPSAPQAVETDPVPAFEREAVQEEIAELDMPVAAAGPTYAVEPALLADPAVPEPSDTGRTAVDLEPLPVVALEMETARELESAAEEPAETEETAGVVADEPYGDAAATGARYLTHTVVYAHSTPEPAPTKPSPMPVADNLPPMNPPALSGLLDILDQLRSYGLVRGYTVSSTHVLLYLFDDGQPLEMDHAGAETFCLDLKRSLPIF